MKRELLPLLAFVPVSLFTVASVMLIKAGHDVWGATFLVMAITTAPRWR